MRGRLGAGTALAYPAMRELLRQCVAEAQADFAFVALLDIEEEENATLLEIPAVFPPAERNPRAITQWVKKGVSQAIKAGRTEATLARTSSTAVRRAGSKMLVVAPMYSASGTAWGAVAIVRGSSVIDWESINPVQQCARAVTNVLTQSDDPFAHSGFAAARPPLTRQRVHSGPREDFLLHELRVPLSAAAYALEALAQRHGPNWDYDDEYLLHTAQSGVDEAQKVVRSVSQWPALGNAVTRPLLQPVNVEEMLARALTLLPTAHQKVSQQVDRSLPPVRGNESWITQVLVNLLENALKYSSAHRDIEVAIHQPDADFVVIRVRSWGNVLSFNRGYLARSGERGTYAEEPTSKGMGLNIARYFVTSLGGELRIEGEGTGEFAVTVALPVATADANRRLDEM